MYIPPAFSQTAPDCLAQFIATHSFALLVSAREGIPSVSHLPLLYEPQPGTHGTLYGHMARANGHWREAVGDVLAVFSGPHAYVSPTWYDSEQVVPTWNYAAVHVRGRLTLVEDAHESLEVLGRLVEFYERGMPKSWKFDPDDPWMQRLAEGIVAFRIAVTAIEGKWKLSQNQPPERRHKVIDALTQSGDDQSRQVAQMMTKALAGSHP
ncbi:MAG: FMN-binding negative transcriptional regulator [Planctomycetales bacterium]